MRHLLQSFINTLLSGQADAVCGADYGTRSTERTNRRNGYRHRDLDTRVGTLDVAIPKLREGWWGERDGSVDTSGRTEVDVDGRTVQLVTESACRPIEF